MTRLRKMMLEELDRRNYAALTTNCYIQAVEDLVVVQFGLPYGVATVRAWF